MKARAAVKARAVVKTRAAMAIIAIIAIAAMFGCAASAPAGNDAAAGTAAASAAGAHGGAALKVVASIYPMYDFALKVGGGFADVSLLMRPGTEPHDWEPTPSDIARLAEARVFVYNGSGMEPWAPRVIESLGGVGFETAAEPAASGEAAAPGASSVSGEAAASGVSSEAAASGVSSEATVDAASGEAAAPGASSVPGEAAAPGAAVAAVAGDSGSVLLSCEASAGMDADSGAHAWIAPELAKREMERIKNAFAIADPEHADEYENAFLRWGAEFDALGREFAEALGEGAVSTRKLFVTHAAFGPLCAAYGLEQVAALGVDPEAEPDPARMAEMIAEAREVGAKAIFFEDSDNSKVAQAIAEGVGDGCAAVRLYPVESLSSDEIGAGEDYFSKMRENLATIQAALK